MKVADRAPECPDEGESMQPVAGGIRTEKHGASVGREGVDPRAGGEDLAPCEIRVPMQRRGGLISFGAGLYRPLRTANHLAAASALSSGRVLNAIAAPGAIL